MLSPILVVDDEPDVRETIAEVLRTEGYAVDEAQDGVEALRKAHAHRPAAILLDLNMPGMDGRECNRRLRQDHLLKNVPVVVVSACLADEVHAMHAVAHLHKPFPLQDLLNVVSRVLGASQPPCRSASD